MDAEFIQSNNKTALLFCYICYQNVFVGQRKTLITNF